MPNSSQSARCSGGVKVEKRPHSEIRKSGKSPSPSPASSGGSSVNDDVKSDRRSARGRTGKINRNNKRAAAVGRSVTNSATNSGSACVPPAPEEEEKLPFHGFETLDFKLYHGIPKIAGTILMSGWLGAGVLFKRVCAKLVERITPENKLYTAGLIVGLGLAAVVMPTLPLNYLLKYDEETFHHLMMTPYTHYRYSHHLNRPMDDTRPDANARTKMKHQMNLIQVRLDFRFQLQKSATMTICSETLTHILAPGVIAGSGEDKNSVLEAACRRLSSVNQDRRHIMTGDDISKNTIHVARAILLSSEQRRTWKTRTVGF